MTGHMITVQQNGKSRTFTCTVYCTAELPSQDIHMTTIQKNRKSRTFTCTVPILYSRTVPSQDIHMTTVQQNKQSRALTWLLYKEKTMTTVQWNRMSRTFAWLQHSRTDSPGHVRDYHRTHSRKHSMTTIQQDIAGHSHNYSTAEQTVQSIHIITVQENYQARTGHLPTV
jgi:hypothetical protein